MSIPSFINNLAYIKLIKIKILLVFHYQTYYYQSPYYWVILDVNDCNVDLNDINDLNIK